MPDRPETLPVPQSPDGGTASHAMLKEVQQTQHKSYLQTGVDAVLDATIGSDSSVGKEISRYAPGFIQTAALFTPGRKAFLASMAVGAANEVRVGDSLQMQLTEFGMGAAKGAATKALFNRVGNNNIMNSGLWSVPAKGVFLGTSSRAIDVGLTPHNWLNKQGDFDPTQAIGKTLVTAFDPKSMALDVAIFGIAHGGTAGLNRLTGGAIERSQMARNITMGTTFGATSGATHELMTQSERGGPLDWSEIAKRGLYQAVVDGVASAPGAYMGARNRPVVERETTGGGTSDQIKTAISEKGTEIKDAISSAVEEVDGFGRRTAVAATIGLAALEPTGGRVTPPQLEPTSQVVAEHVVAAGSDKIKLTKGVVEFGDHIKLVNLVPGERQVLRGEPAVVRGSGTVDVKGSNTYTLEVPEGQTMRVVYKSGDPQIHISEASKGTIEYVNQSEQTLLPKAFLTPEGQLRPDVKVLHPLADVFTPNEIAEIVKIQQIHQEVAKRVPTVSDAEKQAISDATYVPAKTQGGVLDIVVGPPGAGKTTNVVEPLAEKRGATVIDGDAINPLIPGYENGLGQVAVGPISGEIRSMNLKRAFENKDNVILPFIGRQLPLMEQIISDARAAGYGKIAVHYVEVSPEVSARRVFSRAMEPPNEQGIRQVIDPEWALRRVNDGVTRVFEDLINRPGYLDEFAHYFGEVPRGEKFPLIRSSDGPLKDSSE